MQDKYVGIRFVVVVLCLLVIFLGHYTYVHEHFSVNTQRIKYLSVLSCMQTDAPTPNIVGQQCWELLAQKFDRFQTLRNNSQQHARTCNRVCKRTQHLTSNKVGSCWPTLLLPFARGFRKDLTEIIVILMIIIIIIIIIITTMIRMILYVYSASSSDTQWRFTRNV